MDLPRVFGRNVRDARKAKGMSQEALAFEAELMRSYISDLERGQRNPSLKAIGKIADALGVEPWRLLKPSQD